MKTNLTKAEVDMVEEYVKEHGSLVGVHKLLNLRLGDIVGSYYHAWMYRVGYELVKKWREELNEN